MRRVLGALLILVATVAVTACDGTGSPVSIYMRNDTNVDASFAFRPVQDPLLAFAIPANDVGGSCVVAPDGWEFVHVPDGRAPDDVADLPTLQRAMLRGQGQPQKLRVIWAWVDGNGLVRSGEGLPAWWVGERQEACA